MSLDLTAIRCSAAWAARRQERLRAALGEDAYRDLEAAVLWGLGLRAQDLQAHRDLGRSSLYEHLDRVLKTPPALDQARENEPPAPPPSGLPPALAARVVELLVGQRLEPAAIAKQLAAQDGTQLSSEAIQSYLQAAGLADYIGSPFREQAVPAQPTPPGTFSRYAAHLLELPALTALGYDQVMPLLDVTRPSTHYSHWLRCYTLSLALAAGNQRLYQTGELVPDEFAAVLGAARYPQRSDLHAYLDRIVARDQAEAQGPEPERIVGRFLEASQTALAQAAGPGAGQAVYVDAHTIALYTAQPVAQTKHGVWQRVVKALVQVRAVSATAAGRSLRVTVGPGDTQLGAQLESTVAAVEQATGEPVLLVGVDRGALSQDILEAFERRGTGLVVWADDTPLLRQALAAVPAPAFVDGEYTTTRRADGQRVRRLKTRLADQPGLVINTRGYACRTVVVEDVRTPHRAAFHVVGAPTTSKTARELLAFLRGKQRVAEEFKPGRAWGSDAFCGGAITAHLRREPPTPAEVELWRARARRLKERWYANLVEEAAAVTQWRQEALSKRALNDLRTGIRRRRNRIPAAWREAEALIRWGRTGQVPPSQVRWVVDTRKLSLLTQFQDWGRQARRDTVAWLRQHMAEVLLAEALAARAETPEERERQALAQEVQAAVQRMPWGQLTARFFAQGGWVHQDPERRIMQVTLKPFEARLVQQACERLCVHLNSLSAVMHCEDGDYVLQYACQPWPPG